MPSSGSTSYIPEMGFLVLLFSTLLNFSTTTIVSAGPVPLPFPLPIADPKPIPATGSNTRLTKQQKDVLKKGLKFITKQGVKVVMKSNTTKEITKNATNKMTCAKEPCMLVPFTLFLSPFPTLPLNSRRIFTDLSSRGGLTRPQFIAVMCTVGVVLIIISIALFMWRKKKADKEDVSQEDNEMTTEQKNSLVDGNATDEDSITQQPVWAAGSAAAAPKPWQNVETRYEPFRPSDQ